MKDKGFWFLWCWAGFRPSRIMSHWQGLIGGRGFKCPSAEELWCSSRRYHLQSGFDGREREREKETKRWQEEVNETVFVCLCSALQAPWFLLLSYSCFASPLSEKNRSVPLSMALSLWLSPSRWVARINQNWILRNFDFILPPAWGL